MIYLNYELYDLDKDDSYIKLKEYCNELGFPIILKRSSKYMKKIPKVIGGKTAGAKTHMPGKFFDYNHTERSAGGSKTWRYSLYPIRKDKDGYPEFEGDHGEFLSTLSLVFDEYDLEKLWFLLEKSNIVKGREVYSIYDPEKEYRERAEKESDSIGVKFYIMAKESPLSIGQLRVIAKYFGIPKVDDMTDAKLKNVLFDHVDSLQRNKKDGYKEFMKATKVDKFVTMKASLQDAIDKDIIGWMPRNLTWNWLDAAGNPLSMICQLNAQDEKNKFDVLMDFILANEEHLKRLERELGDFSPDEEEIDLEKLEKDKDDGGYSYSELVTFSKKIPGFNPIGKSYKVVSEKLMEFYA